MQKDKRDRAIDIILPVIIGGIILVVVLGQWAKGTYGTFEAVTRLSKGWYYMEDGVRKEVTIPTTIKQEEGNELVLYNDSLTEEDEEKTLTTRAAVYRLGIYLDDKELYQYEDEAFPRNVQMASKVNCTTTLTHDLDGKTLAMVYQNTENGVYHIHGVYIGKNMAILKYLLSNEAFLFVTVFIFGVLGVLTIGIAMYLRYIKVQEKRFLNCASFLLICGVWFATDSSFAQTISRSTAVTLTISFYAFMLLAIPILYFVKNTGSMSKYKQIDICIYAFYANAVVQSLLRYFEVFEFVEMLFVTHFLLAGGVTTLIVVMVKEYRESHDRELLAILYAFSALAAGGISALILYWLLEIPYYGIFFDCGILAFVILLIRSIIITMVENLRFKTEMKVYQRMEKEDRLTGLKNRKAFDEFIIELEQTAETYKDVVLVFMDLNHLKNINDRFGYGVGNEAIITASRCIEKAFAPEGECFRIGGDEFCVVLKNETAGDDEIFERLNAQISVSNKNNKFRLSIARGISHLRDEKGYLKTVSDWKQEADLSMYEDKGWVRAEDRYEGREL